MQFCSSRFRCPRSPRPLRFMASGSGKARPFLRRLTPPRRWWISANPRVSTKFMFPSPRAVWPRRRANSFISSPCSIARTFESKPCYRARMPTSPANIEKLYWITFAKSCNSIRSIPPIDSTGFTSMSSRNNDRKIKARATWDFCQASQMLFAPCAQLRSRPV